jgi:hypothetical protein
VREGGTSIAVCEVSGVDAVCKGRSSDRPLSLAVKLVYRFVHADARSI